MEEDYLKEGESRV